MGLNHENDVVYESDNVFSSISLHHHENSGPTFLVIPKQHVENIYEIDVELLSEVMGVVKHIAAKSRELWKTEGITIWQHNEPCGSQDVWHLHVHVKCRLLNDNLYNSKKILTDEVVRNNWTNELKSPLSAIEPNLQRG